MYEAIELIMYSESELSMNNPTIKAVQSVKHGRHLKSLNFDSFLLINDILN